MEEVGLQGIDKSEMHGIPMKIKREEGGCCVAAFADLGAFDDKAKEWRDRLRDKNPQNSSNLCFKKV